MAPPTLLDPSSRQRWWWRNIGWLGAVLVAGLTAYAAFDLVNTHRTAVRDTERRIATQARVVAEQTTRSVQAIDLVLRHLAMQSRGSTAAALHDYLKDQLVGLIQVESLAVFDADGRLVANSRLADPPPFDISADPLFRQLRSARSTQPLIGTTRSALFSEVPVFPIARRVETQDGRFAGIVHAGARVEYFQQFYNDMQLDSGASIVLLHSDGSLLARHPPHPAALGRRIADVADLLAGERTATSRPIRGVSPIDGVDRFGVAREITDYPLLVVVTRDAALALLPWRDQAAATLIHTLLLGLLSLLLLWLVRRQFRRLDQTRQSLELSRERFALAAAGSDEGIWDWDLAGDRVYASARAREIFGLEPGPDVSSRSEWFDKVRLHPDDVQARRDAMRSHLSGATPVYAGEYRVLGSDGRYRWLRVRGLCVRNAAGEPLRMAGSVTDIDDRKRTEEALRLSEERFALAVAGSNDGIVDWDIVNDRMYTSERAMEMLGVDSTVTVRSRAEWMKLLRIHPDDRQRHADDLSRFLASKEILREGEYRIAHLDGSCRWVRIRNLCVRDAQGQPLRLAGSVSDIDPYKRVEAALRESEQQYALAMTGSNEGHYVWDIASDDFFASAKLNQIMGLPDGAKVMKYAERTAQLHRLAEDEPRVRQAIDDLLAGVTEQMDIEYRIVPPDGNGIRWIQSRGRCFRDAAGKPVRVAGSITDITARKQADEALRLSKERFALAVAGSDDGVWDWDFTAGVAFESARARELQGLPPGPEEQPLPELLDSLRVHPDDAERRAEGIRAHLAGETPAYECEYRVRHDDGEYRWIRVRALCIRNDDGKPCRMAGSVSDIDSRKRAEEGLRRSDERYQLAVAGSNEGLWDWDLASDSLFLSPRAQELLWQQAGPPQRPRREWIAMTIYHPDDIGVVRNAIAAHLHGQTRHFKVEYRVRRDDGEWRWYRQRGIAVRDANGQPTRMAGSMEDITERKNSEAERERLEVQLRQAQKLEAIGTLAGGIAHDFNNILAAILGYGEMAQRDAAEGSVQRRNIDAALAAGLRAKSLVERILAFSRSGMGERRPVHVQSVVEEALDVVASSLPSGIELERQLEAGDAAVHGDPTQVHQVVMNLCANAVQAMKTSGCLTVKLERIRLNEPCCTTSVTLASGEYVALSVSDTGSGIAAPLLERIFDPFFTTKEVGVGTGLGLSLVHGIVTDLGGGICVDSRVGFGSTFTAMLPWQHDITPAAAIDEAMVPNGNGETILLVDDEEPLVRLGEEMVAMLGYEPVGFTSSLDALATFRADPERFHAVLSDEAMPDMTGSELIAQIRSIRPDIPIVLMSGYVTAALAARARDAGVAEVLSKPLVSRDIARSLACALHR